MIKKIILTLTLCIILISCGKKGDPVLKESKSKIEIHYFLTNRV